MAEEAKSGLDVPAGEGDRPSSRQAWQDPTAGPNPTGSDLYDGNLDSARDPVAPAEDAPAAMESEKLPRSKAEKARKPLPGYQPTGFVHRFHGGVRSIWRTRQTETKIDKQKFITTTLRELIIYLVFLLILCIIAFGMTGQEMFFYTRGLEELFLDEETPQEKKFKQLNTAEDFWNYIGADDVGNPGPFLSGLYWEHWYDRRPVTRLQKGYISFENKLLGLARIRMLRVTRDSCDVPDLFQKARKNIKHCYSSYAERHENRSSFGPQNGTAWEYTASSELGGTSYTGLISKYGGGGFYLELPATVDEAIRMIMDLKKNMWTDRATRVVFADFTVYNANINLFCVVKLVFEFPASGGVIPTTSFRTVRLIRYVRTFDYFVLGCEIAFCLFILYYIVEELIEIAKHRWNYFKGFWNLADIIVILISVGCIAYSIYRTVEVENKLTALLENERHYANFEFLSSAETKLNDAIAILMFFAWTKIFKYISFNKTMNQLSTTMSRCAKDLAAFSIIFFIFFFAYCQLGYLIFGRQVKDYHTFFDCIFTLLRTILGDFEYRKMEEANRILGPIFFLTYIMLIFFVLLNMFLAIINDTYAEVKDDLALAKNDFELSHYLRYNYDHMLRKLHLKKDKMKDIEAALTTAKRTKDGSVDYDEWRFVLKQRGYPESQIESLFARYDTNNDRLLDKGEQRVMKDELAKRQVDIEQIEINMTADTPQAAASTAKRESERTLPKTVSQKDFAVLNVRVERLGNTIQDLDAKIDLMTNKVEAVEQMKMRHREEIAKLVQKAFRPDKSDSEKLAACEAGLTKEMERFLTQSDDAPEDP